MLVANNNYEILDNNQQDEYNIVLKSSNGDKIALEYIIKKYKNFFKKNVWTCNMVVYI